MRGRLREAMGREGEKLSSPEIMRRIAQAEKQSRQLVAEAERDVTKMKRDLPDRIAAIREQILREATEQREKALIQADGVGAEEADRIVSEARKQVESLSRIGETKRKLALEKAMTLLLS